MKTLNLTGLSKLTILAASMICLSLNSVAQAPTIEWERAYGGNHVDFLIDIRQTSDGGYILGGNSMSGMSGEKSDTSRGDNDIWIIKIDANGNVLWDKTYGGSDNDRMSSIIQTTDGGYAIVGPSYSNISGEKSENSRGNQDTWLLKTDANGNLLWDKTYGGSDFEGTVSKLQQTSDGGYIIATSSQSGISGEKSEASQGQQDIWLIKTDAVGNLIWDKTIGGSSTDVGLNVFELSGGGYMIAGHSNSPISGDKTSSSRGQSDFWVLRTDGSGTVLWDSSYGGSDSDNFPTMDQTPDGGYILAGYSKSPISGDKSEGVLLPWDFWVVRIDSNGTILWEETVQGDESDVHAQRGDVSMVNNSFLLAGQSNSGIANDKTDSSRGALDMWIMQLDSNRNILWDLTLGGSSNDQVGCYRQTSDGGFIIGGGSLSGVSGERTDPSRGIYDYWVVKLSAPTTPPDTSGGACIDTITCGKKNNKVQICHVPPGNPGAAHEICIGLAALETHLTQHDDYCGPCDSTNKTSNKTSVYPNPSRGSFTIISAVGISSIQVIDVFGQIHWSKDYSGEQRYAEIDLSTYARGIYFIRIVGEGYTTTEKLILQN